MRSMMLQRSRALRIMRYTRSPGVCGALESTRPSGKIAPSTPSIQRRPLNRPVLNACFRFGERSTGAVAALVILSLFQFLLYIQTIILYYYNNYYITSITYNTYKNNNNFLIQQKKNQYK